MQIILLTHQRELEKTSNTGQLVLKTLKQSSKRIVWERPSPNADLMALIEQGGVGLLYPEDTNSTRVAEIPSEVLSSIVVLDGTWQESAKMYNRSPYLHALPRVSLSPVKSSAYKLRRNQRAEGLCTAEAVAEVLEYFGNDSDASAMRVAFVRFNHGY